MNLEILFEDNHVLIVNKRAGILSTSDKSDDASEEHATRLYLSAQKKIPVEKVFLKPVHQLDRPVSGCLIFAKSSKATERLAEAFRGQKIDKIYHLLSTTKQQLKDEEWVDDLLWDCKLRRAVVKKGHKEAKKSALIISTLSLAEYGLYEVQLISGRKHQIRIQAASRGFPILGDITYGGKTFAEFNKNRIALHCARLSLPHPISGRIEVSANVQKNWAFQN